MKHLLFSLLVFCASTLAFAQNDITVFVSAGGNAGYGAEVFKHLNEMYTDVWGQDLGRATFTSFEHGPAAGGRLIAGAEWRNVQFGFRFGYDGLFVRRQRSYLRPDLFNTGTYTGNVKTDYHIFSYCAQIGYSVKALKKLHITPRVSLGSFTGFVSNHHVSFNNPAPKDRWGFHHFMRNKFYLNAACMLEVPFKRFSFFVSPEYSFLFWQNTTFEEVMDKTRSSFHTGGVEVGVKANLHTFAIGKASW